MVLMSYRQRPRSTTTFCVYSPCDNLLKAFIYDNIKKKKNLILQYFGPKKTSTDFVF